MTLSMEANPVLDILRQNCIIGPLRPINLWSMQRLTSPLTTKIRHPSDETELCLGTLDLLDTSASAKVLRPTLDPCI